MKRRRRHFIRGLVALAAAIIIAPAALVAPTAFAAPDGPGAGQRVDMRVLIVSPAADGLTAVWQETLGKLGVAYDTVTSGITDATLADYAGNHAKYEAIILTSSLAATSAGDRAALDKYETTFGVREISDNTNPDAPHGATFTGGSVLATAATGSLTAAGKTLFPYLNANVPVPAGVFAATGKAGPSFTPLVNAANGDSYMGIYKRPNGTEQLVDGIPGNGQQTHYQLLRFGMLNWVTRGVYLGYWRNYFEVQVDDLFLGDDAWDPATHSNNYDPTVASRMTPTDLAQALGWSQVHNFRFDFAYNAGGHDALVTAGAPDPLWDAFAGNAAYRTGFGFINHTYDHAFLGCSSANYITWEITKNAASGQAIGLPLNTSELVTGEHSGLANTRPGNPGVLDPPNFDTVDAATTGGTLAAGSYDYAVTVSNETGQTSSPAPVSVVTTGATSSVHANVSMVCKGTAYSLYRRTSEIPAVGVTPAVPAGAWVLAAQKVQSADTQTDNGAAVNPTETPVALIDTGAPVAAPAAHTSLTGPPAGDDAAMAPYAMNPRFTTGLANAHVTVTATDASKAYPIETSATVPTAVTVLPQNAAGAVFNLLSPSGTINTVPRYPTNVYYNASKQGQQLDEYNWIYTATANGGGCTDIPNVTTCNSAPVTWEGYLASESSIVMLHITGNDPRPHYAHQSNLADWNLSLGETNALQGGILYPYLDNILGIYHGLYADNTPIVQLTSTQISTTLLRAQTYAANVAAGRVSSYTQDNALHIVATAPMDVPITGALTGEAYAGRLSQWLSVPAGETVVPLAAPVVTPVGQTGTTPVTGPGSTPTTTVKTTIPTTIKAKQGARPAITKFKMSTRTFGVARKGLALKRSSSKISYKLSRAASVRLLIQRKMVTKVGTKKKKITWLNMGAITSKKAKQGTNLVTFKGKVGGRKLTKGSYRIVATATAGGQTSVKHTLTFTMVTR